MAKRKIEYEVETDKDIETKLWPRSCELCKRRNAGKGGKQMPAHCIKCIMGKDSPEFSEGFTRKKRKKGKKK